MVQSDFVRFDVEWDARRGHGQRIADDAMALRGDKAQHRGSKECEDHADWSEEEQRRSNHNKHDICQNHQNANCPHFLSGDLNSEYKQPG